MGLRQHKKNQTVSEISSGPFQKFDNLDGDHPWMTQMPEGYVAYRVRELGIGNISYFNFALAKEMGLIPETQPHLMTRELKEKVIKTFSIQIINEYDELNQKKINPNSIKPKKFMASRYLQLQHFNKQGKTSGDGRGIWNGIVKHHGKTWDVSSRGTGVTCLAPGAVEANRPLKTGDGKFGYGCGLAEIDELYGASIMAEIMHLQGIQTERVLCIIDLGNNYGIGVRAAQNLLRPAHLFMYLKQNRLSELKKSVEYFIQRQIQNGKWNAKFSQTNQYETLVERMSDSFARFTAQLDIDYIFAWLDWDGDNVLMDAGIIDYGSVRQFGARHDQYRYDDVERFSTNLNEQRLKAKLMVQVFAQMSDYLKTGKRKQLKDFAKHPAVQKFNEHFAFHRAHRLLYRMGFNEVQRNNIIKEKGLFDRFDREFSYFEKAKVSGTVQKVADGVNHPALFNLRIFLKTFPGHLLDSGFDSEPIPEKIFFKSILSSFAKSKDMKIRPKHQAHIKNLQFLYKLLILASAGKQKPEKILTGISERAVQLNREDRITGNALIQIVNEIMEQVQKGMPSTDVQKIIDQLIYTQIGMPEVSLSSSYQKGLRIVPRQNLYQKILNLVQEHKDDI